jgi:hypothetical protein
MGTAPNHVSLERLTYISVAGIGPYEVQTLPEIPVISPIPQKLATPGTKIVVPLL